jgi:hypothetical protein
MTKPQSLDKPPAPITRYKWEYSNFLDFVKKRKVSRAIIYAKSLGIERNVLVTWMRQPELREAMTDAIDEVVEGMKSAGHKDWRMWRELYAMLGMDDVKNLDVTSDGKQLPIVMIEGVYGQEPKFRIDNNSAETTEVAENSSDKPS